MIVLGPLCSRLAHYPGVPNLPVSSHLSVSFSWTGIVCLITLCIVRSLAALKVVYS